MRTVHAEHYGCLNTDILTVVDHLCKTAFLLNLILLSFPCHLPYLSALVQCDGLSGPFFFYFILTIVI